MSGHRLNVRFSADGSRAACLAVGDRGRTQLEGWELTANGPRCWLRVPLAGEPGRSHAVPVAGDRLLLAAWRDGRQRLSLVGPAGVLATRPVPDLRITAAPAGRGLALGLAGTPAGSTQAFLIEDGIAGPDGAWRSIVTEIRQTLRGAGIVAGDGVVFHVRVDGAAVPVVVDLSAGGVTRPGLPPAVRGAVPIHAAGTTLLVGASVRGQHRLARLSLRDPGGWDELDRLDQLDGSVQPLALDPSGSDVALRLRTGIRSRLLRYQAATGQLSEITAPAGTAAPQAAWTSRGLWLPYATTTAPVGLWWLPPGGAQLRPEGGTPTGRHPGRVETFAGQAGPIEAVVYGDWRTSNRVVLALHGGPAEHWSLTFDAGLQAMATAGLAVVAPNPRGSSGYGRAFEEAIKGAWGGPDLADVVAVGSHLVRVRADRLPRPALYGSSYGAFLGLLALAEEPDLWSACVAVAPFLSGARLYADAGPPVRALLDRLDGTAAVDSGRGPRDLLRLVPRMRGPILVIHGECDETIPVRHSRELVAALATQAAVTVAYREVTGRGHQAIRQTVDAPEFSELVRFLGGDVPLAMERR